MAQWTGRRVWSGWGARWFLRRVRRRRRRRRRRSTGVVVVVVDAAVARPTVAVLHSWTSVVRRRPSSSRVVISVECQSSSSVCVRSLRNISGTGSRVLADPDRSFPVTHRRLACDGQRIARADGLLKSGPIRLPVRMD